MEIFETALPGIGTRFEFETTRGVRLAVVVRRDGQRELIVYDESDPDSSRASVTLGSREAAAMVELMGGSRITERLVELRHEVEGLSIEWVTVADGVGLAGRTIGDGRIRTASGASVVAVIRGTESVPAPGPEFVFTPGDVVLVMGTSDGVRRAAAILAP